MGIIGFGAVTAICLLIPADLEFLAAICAFGATIAFTIVGLSVCRLRYKEPDRDRPYKMPFNVRVRGGELPIPGVLCVMLSYTAFVALLVEHGDARWIGVLWMVAGITLYVGYRTSQGKPVLQARDRAGVGADAARGRGRVRLDPRARARARRSTTTSCRPPGGSPPRSTTTTRAAR